MSAPAPVGALFRCDGAAVPRGWRGERWDEEHAVTTGEKGHNLDLKVEPLAAKVVGVVSARAADLVRIAAYAYCADQRLPRGGRVDVHREGWRRRLALCVPVSDPAFWADPPRLVALQEVLGFLTDDEWAFAFDQGDPAFAQIPMDLPGLPLAEPPDCVALVSGGSDSLCALVELAAAGRRPLVVSHRSAAQLDRRQQDLLRAVRGRFPDWPFPQVSFWVQRQGGDAANAAQRSRAFLYAALGAAVGGEVGIPQVALPDNGYVSLNPPISGQLVGALASRSTHPTFLRLVNRLLAGAFAAPVAVGNPLVGKTRAEALAVLAEAGCPELLGLTHSCGNHRGRPNDTPHCGGCSQCVDRRFAGIAAGLEAHDPSGRYGLDVFVDGLPEGEPRTVAEGYVRFARASQRATDDALFADYPHLYAALDPDDPRLGETALKLTGVLHRHAAEVTGVLATMLGRHAGELAQGNLPPSCLLRLAAGSLAGGWDTADEIVLGAPPGGATDAAGGGNLMERRSGVWHVWFRGDKGTYADSVGLARLARLLAAPGQGIGSLSLKVGPTSGNGAKTAGVGKEDGLRVDDAAAADELIDAETERAYKERAKALEVGIAEAREIGDDGAVAHQLHELERIATELRRARGLGGRRRKTPDQHEAARKTVQKTVRAAIDAFAPDLPQLHAHLDRSIRLGLTCRYDPDPPERWRVAS